MATKNEPEQVNNAPDAEQGTIANHDVTGLPPHSHQDDEIPESGGGTDPEPEPEPETKSKK